MCGEIKPWQYTHQVVVRLTQTLSAPNVTGPYNRVTVSLGGLLEHVAEVRLTEYHVEEGLGNSTLWRVGLKGSNFNEEMTTNAGGEGHCIAVPQLGANTFTHVVYENPRVLSRDVKGGIAQLRVEVNDEFGVPAQFTSMTIMLTFVMNKPHWSIADVDENHRNFLEWWRPQQFNSRFLP